jgi:23S rRNA maturation mini-RNase III
MEQSLDNDLVKCIYEGLDMKHTEPSQLSPLVLAYIGDSIYDLVIKTWVIEQGNMQVDETINNMKEIVEEVKKIDSVIMEIASSAEEQKSGVEEINKAIADLDEVTQTNAGIAEETSASTHILMKKAEEFLEVVEYFKINKEEIPQVKTKIKNYMEEVKHEKVETIENIKHKNAKTDSKELIPFDDEIEEV